MFKEGFTFNDVLLSPKYSELQSRSEANTTVKLDGIEYSHPIIPAPMRDIAGYSMCIANSINGGLSILNRFIPISEQFDIAEEIISEGHRDRFGVSVGVKGSDKEEVYQFYEIGIRIFNIDIAHGDSLVCTEMIRWIRETFPQVTIIAGNVATGEGAQRLWKAGANVVRVGVGNGGNCTTRIKTAAGVPQLTALIDVNKSRDSLKLLDRSKGINNEYLIISDGGVTSSGDLVKALCLSDFVMTGALFAGCEEAPGKIIEVNGVKHKEYAGSSTHKASHIEGVIKYIPLKGSFYEILTDLLEGIRSGMSYQGVNNLSKLKENFEFIKITQAGLIESMPHNKGISL